MTHEEILIKAIEKAAIGEGIDIHSELSKVSKTGLAKSAGYMLEYQRYYAVIFEQSFAKAFWGEHDYKVYCDKFIEDMGSKVHYTVQKHWQYHLQQMVLEEDPIRYLEQFL